MDSQYRDPNDPLGGGFLPAQQTPSAPGDLGLGATPPAASSPSPAFGQLKNDATNYYLANGGTQANVDSYFQQNPGQNYNKLAADAAQWYTDPNRSDSNTDWAVQAVMPPGGGPQTNIPTTQDYTNSRNQNVGNYFGIPAPPAGQNFNYAPAQQTPAQGQRSVPIGADLRWQGATPEGLMQQFNGLDPARQQEYYNYYNSQPANVQQQWRSAFGILDPSIQSGMAGGQDLLKTPSGLGSPSTAMQSAQTAAPIPGPNGNMHSGDDDGYTAAGGPAFTWEGGTPPTASYTTGGQQNLNTPMQTAEGQQFGGLQQFLDYMLKSTPGSQAVKGKLEGLDPQGGSREAGEGSLFDVLAPYLTPNGASPPTNGTPFSQAWDPSSLLQLLMKSGILRR